MSKMNTFLSDYVHDVLVDLGQKSRSKCPNCLNGLYFNWQKMTSLLCVEDTVVIPKMPPDWLKDKIVIIWQIINEAGEALYSSSEEDKKLFWVQMRWLGDVAWISNEYEEMKLNDSAPLLMTLKLTSFLERALGNVYLLKGKQVPFLLRDLLSTDELRFLLGKTPVIFMQFLFGCVLGLNVRNVVWHGFLAPSELNPNIVAALLVLISSVGRILGNIDIPTRPLIDEKKILLYSYTLNAFHEDIGCYFRDFKCAIKNCHFIAESQQNCWFEAFRLYEECRFGDSLILLLPQMEQMLRSIYCCANKCETRVATAESDAFYITLDDILSPTSNANGNKIKEVFGENILEMLLDAFSYEEGPRLRDRLSHGELPFDKIIKTLINHVFIIALCIIWKTSTQSKFLGITLGSESKPNICENGEHVSLFVNIKKYCETYESVYHPISLVKQSMLDALVKLSEWQNFTKPDSFLFNQLILYFNIATNELSNEDNLIHYISRQVIYLQTPTLYRPRKELEIVSLLGHIINIISLIHKRIKHNNSTKFLQWEGKTLRSRGRVNYLKMWKGLPRIQNFLLSIMLFATNVLRGLPSLSDGGYRGHLRYLKLCLQCTENIFSLSDEDKNNWDKIESLILEFENASWKFLQYQN